MDNFNIINIKTAKLYNFAESKDINISNAFTSIFLELFLPLRYGYSAYECAESYIEPNDVVVDCGANLGLFSAWAASHSKKVYCFEPANGIIPYLNKTINLYKNIIHIPKAVGEICTTKLFTECHFSCGSHLSQININESCLFKDEYLIDMTNLNTIFQEEIINFIKIDVEGFEAEVIKGADKIILRDKPKLAVACYHYKNEIDIIKQLILSINPSYQFKQKKDVLIAWVN